jgi:hypothetical protein
METRLVQVTQSLAEYKHRAHTAEVMWSPLRCCNLLMHLFFRCSWRRPRQTPAVSASLSRSSRKKKSSQRSYGIKVRLTFPLSSNPVHIHPACSRHYQRALARGAPPPAQVLVRHERRPPPGHQCRPAVHHDASRRQQTIRDARTARNHPRVDRPRTRARGITAHGRRRAATCDRTPLAQRSGRSRPRGKGRAGENR